MRGARELGEKSLPYASPLGLYGEEIDPNTGRQLANMPRALTHLALVDALTLVTRLEAAADPRSGGGFGTFGPPGWMPR